MRDLAKFGEFWLERLNFLDRQVSEWLKEHAWNACKVQAFEGSNPFLSAINSYSSKQAFYPRILGEIQGICVNFQRI